MKTLSEFLAATGFSRANLPTKKALDTAIAQHNIESDDLIADIYGYFLY